MPSPAPGDVAVTLPADGSSPARARRHVRAFLADRGLPALVDDVLLLVTELVTNAVVHAGTASELRLTTADDGVRVEVVDRSPTSSPVVRSGPDGDREGGRGLFLLDALADEWGTTHSRDRKSVWFRIGAPAAADVPDVVPALAQPLDGAAAPALGWLLALPGDLEQQLSAAQVLTELVHRLADSLQIDDAALLAASDTHSGTWSVCACRGVPPTDEDVAAVRRLVLSSAGAVLPRSGRTIVVLRGRDGPSGALVLGRALLEPASTAVARLAVERLAMVLRDDRADVAQQRQRGSLALLAEASDLFAATLDVQLAATLATRLVVPRLGQWAAVYSYDDAGTRLVALAHEDEDRAASLRVGLSSTGGSTLAERLARDLAAQRPVLIGRGETHAVLGTAATGDVLALPLVARRRLLGGLVVGRAASDAYDAEDVALLLDLARRAALAVDNARLYEERTAIAQALQASLLPPELPTALDVQFGARYHPAGEGNEVGGDFYDVFPLDRDNPSAGWSVAIGDVCGKGAEAAAITGLARNVVRLLARQGRSPADVLRCLNEAVLELGDRGRFCTAAMAVVRPAADQPGALDVVLSSGGHPPPVLVPADPSGPPSFVRTYGTVLGVVESPDLTDERLRLAPGQALVLYTDGVTERRSGRRMFGDDTLLGVLSTVRGRSADAVADALEREVRTFGAERARDDLAVLVVRATGMTAVTPPPSGRSAHQVDDGQHREDGQDCSGDAAHGVDVDAAH